MDLFDRYEDDEDEDEDDEVSSAKTDLASDPQALRPDPSAGYSASHPSHVSCAS